MLTEKRLRIALVLIMALALVFLSPGGALADAGWKSPSADQAGVPGGFDSATNAYGDDSDEADTSTSGNSHIYYNYNLGVPDGATISGIEVRLDYHVCDPSGDGVVSVELSWDGGNTWTTAKTDSSEPATETSVYLGGAVDTWGHDWAADALSNASFRLRVGWTSASG